MLRFRKRDRIGCPLLNSQLYSEKSFYLAFADDIRKATTSIVIECPFIGQRRLDKLRPILRGALRKGVAIVINTRSPAEHEGQLKTQAEDGIALLQNMGVLVLFTGGHRRKLATIDGKVLYEGSLNILSQNDNKP